MPQSISKQLINQLEKIPKKVHISTKVTKKNYIDFSETIELVKENREKLLTNLGKLFTDADYEVIKRHLSRFSYRKKKKKI